MKKSRRIFSFLAVALSAVLLFASAGALNSAKQVALADDTNSYGKVVTKDSLKAGDYLEYGEYPQSQITGNHATKIKNLINVQFYGGANASISNKFVSTITADRTKNNGTGSGSTKYFTYDSTTGYFVANQDIMYGSDKILSKGDKIMEYISGVDASNKYPVYQINSAGGSVYTTSTLASTSIRSATVRAYIDKVYDGAYYNAGTSSYPQWKSCDCIYCNGACNISAGTVYTNTSNNGTLNSTSHNWSTSWYSSSDCYTLYDTHTSENLNYYKGVWGFGYYTGPDEDSTFYNNYYKHINYLVNSSTKSFCYRYDNGSVKPLSNVGYDTGKFTYMNDGELKNEAIWLYNQAISLTKSKCNKNLVNNQIYKIEISPSITEYRPALYHNYTCSYTIKVWATTDTTTCPYCAETHHYGKTSNVKTLSSTSSTSNSQYIVGQNTVATNNGYDAGKQYYFKVEPIKWKVVKSDSNVYTLQSDIVLDSMYYNLYSNSGSNFQTSYLRNWLNRDGSDTFTEKYNVLDLRTSSYGAFNEIICNVGRYSSGSSYYGQYETNYKKLSSIYGVFSSGLNRYIKGADGINGIKSNYASYATTEKAYSGDTKTTTPSFFQMAFSNADTNMMQAVGGNDHYGRMNFNSTGASNITGSNLVTIPYSATNVVSGGSSYSLNSSVCSDYAKATGLVCSYSNTESVFNYDDDFGTRYANKGVVNNGLIWVEDGYGSFTGITAVYSSSGNRVLQQKRVAWFNDKGKISTNDADNYDQINQSAGVVPVIKLNLNSSSNTVLVRKNSASSNDVYTVEKDTTAGNYKLMTFDSSVKTTDIKVDRYSSVKKGDNKTEITVELNYGNNYKFDYIQFVVTKKSAVPGNSYYNAIEEDLYSNVYTKTTSTGGRKLRSSASVSTNYTHCCVIVDYKTINDNNKEVAITLNDKYDNFEIRAYVITDNESKMAEISGDEIKTIKYQKGTYSISDGKYSTTPNFGTVVLYEGEEKVITLSKGESYYSNIISEGTELKCSGDVILQGISDNSVTHTLKAYRGSGSDATTSLQLLNGSVDILSRYEISYINGIPTFYSNYSGSSFNAGVEHSGTSDSAKNVVNSVIYITDANGENRNNLGDYGSTGKETLSDIKTISGLELSFSVYIKSAYIKNFENIDELIKGKKVEGTEEIKKYLGLEVLGEDGENLKTLITTKNETPADESENKQLDYTSGNVKLTISALQDTYMGDGNSIIYEKYFTVTLTGLTITKESLDSTRLKLITLDGFAGIEQDTYSLSGSDEQTKKVEYVSAIHTSDTTNSNITLTGLGKEEIKHGERVEADFKLNVGYELNKTYDNQGKVASYQSPNITLKYATQVADINGYRLAEKATYPSDYQYEDLQGKNIKLDEDGNRVDFDDNGNLKYYLKTEETNAEGVITADTQDLTYLNGAYYYLKYDNNSGKYAVTFVVPTITATLSITRGVDKGTKKLIFTPEIQVDSTEALTNNYFNDGGLINKTEGDNVYFDSNRVKVVYTCTRVDDVDGTYENYTLVANGGNDTWTITANGVSCSTITINRNQNNKKTYVSSGNDSYKFSMTATYLSKYYPTGGSNEVFGSLTNNSYTGYNYSKKDGDTTKTLVASSNNEKYEPWVIYANSTLGGVVEGGSITTGDWYDKFTLTTGYSNSNWNSVSKQFFIVDPYGSVKEMAVDTSNSNYPSIKVKIGDKEEFLYAKPDLATGMFVLNQKDSNGRFTTIDGSNPYYNYKVVCIDPITVGVYVIKNVDSDNNNNLKIIGKEDSYKAGETVFRLKVDSVVSDITFNIDETGVSDYNYQINFQTTFEGESKNPIILSDSWRTSVTNGGQMQNDSIDSDVIKTIGTAENGQMLIQYYDEDLGTNHNYYFLAPISEVVKSCLNENSKASNTSNTLKITEETSGSGATYSKTYYVNNGTMQKLTYAGDIGTIGVKYSDGGNNYYFTINKIYQFKGWQATSLDGLDDNTTAVELYNNNEYKTLSNNDIEKITWNFKDTKTSVTFQAVYEECEINVEFFSWNMSEDGNGIYNVIKAIKDNNKDDHYSEHFKEVADSSSTIYSVTGIKYDNTIAENGDSYKAIDKYITDYSKFAELSATAFGINKGWYAKSSNAQSDIVKATGKTSFDGLGSEGGYVKFAGWTKVTIWDNKTMYANEDRTVYLSVRINGSDYICECYTEFTLGTTKFTNNTQLYEIYEIGNKEVSVSGFEDNGEYTNDYSVIYDNYSDEVKSAGDLNVTISLTNAYSKAITESNVEAFIKSLTINTLSKYVVSDAYTINFVGTYDSSNWNGTDRKYVFRSKMTKDDNGEDVTEELGYIQFNENYTSITIFIKGVIADVTISTSYTFNRNAYEITIDNPSTTDGQGNSITYGDFYIAYYNVTDESEILEKIDFSATTTQEIKNGNQIIASYSISSGQAIITVYYGYDLYIKFVYNEAFTQYFTTARNFLWQVKIDNSAINFEQKTNFDVESDDLYQCVKDTTNSTEYYKLMDIKNDLELEYCEGLYINRYNLASNSENNGYYSVSLNHEDASNANNYAEYNENVDVVITVKDAYTQFTPVVSASVNGITYPIIFAHLYDIGQSDGTYKTIQTNDGSIKVTYRTGGYYDYSNTSGTATFRLYANAEVEGTYEGYYKFVQVTRVDEEDVETVVTYIKYDFDGAFAKTGEGENETTTNVYSKLAYNYIIKNLNTVYNFTYNVYGYRNNLKWSTTNKNTYTINADNLSNEKTDYYTVTDGSDNSLSYDSTSGEINPLGTVTHGDEVVIKVTMKSAYTQTIPKFKITVGEKTYTINCAQNTILDRVIEENLIIDNTDVYVEGDGCLSRTYTLNIAGLELVLRQDFVYDSVITAGYTSLVELREQLGLSRIDLGNDNKMYESATYTITFTATDSFTIEDVTESYNLNQYYVLFNRHVNYEDNGVIEFVHDSIDNGRAQKYYQVVTANGNASNPFKGATAPGTSVSLTLDNFKSDACDGYSYTGSESTPWIANLGTKAEFSFDSAITKHCVLYAPFTEEQYTVVVSGSAVDNATTNSTWNLNSNNKYGVLTKTNIDDINSDADGVQVKYTNTGKMKVSYQLFHAYDHSSIKFSISKYGELKYNNSSYVGNDNLSISVSKNINGNVTTYTYSYVDNSKNVTFAIITITTLTGELSVGGLSTTYTLEIKRNIDAGNTVINNNTVNGGVITIGVEFVKGTSGVDESTALNTYNVYIHKGEFESGDIVDAKNTSYKYNIYKTVDNAENLDNTNGVTSFTIVHGNPLLANDVKSKQDPIDYDGYNFDGWLINKNKAQKLNIDGSKTSICNEINLYEVYKLKTAQDIVANNSYGNLETTGEGAPKYTIGTGSNAIFKNITIQGKSSVQYTDEVTVKYTLIDACSSNDGNLQFEVNNATITSCIYDKTTLTYTLTLKYFRGDESSYNVRLVSTFVSVNTYEVEFKYYYDYTSNYSEEDGWTQSIEIKGYNFSGASLAGTYVHGLDASNRTANLPKMNTITEINLQGFSNSDNLWMYICQQSSNANIGDDVIEEVILKVLNMGDCLSDGGNVTVKVEDVNYTVGIFEKGTDGDGTQILGRMVVVPYYVRNEIMVTFKESIEDLEDFSEIKVEDFTSVSDDADSYRTTYIPYGMPLDKALFINYNFVDYSNDALDVVEYWGAIVNSFADSKYQSFIFNTFKVGSATTSDLSTIIVKSEITVDVNYDRRTYTVTVYSNSAGTDTKGTFDVKYGQEFGKDFDVINLGITADEGKHIAGWRDFYEQSNDEPDMIITSNRSFYSNIEYDKYNVSINVENPDRNANKGYTIYYTDGYSVGSKDGDYYTITSNRNIIVEYDFSDGYAKQPNLTVLVNGENKNVLEVTYTRTSKQWKLTIKFKARELKNDDVVDIKVAEQISTYSITWPEDATITSSGSTYRLAEYSFENRYGRGYRQVIGDMIEDGNAVIFYIENRESLNHGESLVVSVLVVEKYLKSSTIKFTISAGANSRTFELVDLSNSSLAINEGKDKRFECVLDNITDNITISIDTENTQIVSSQYNITYHYVYGGGVNGWTENQDNKTTITVQANDTFGTYDVVKGSIPTAPAVKDGQYSPYVNKVDNVAGGKWYVSKNGPINLGDINKENIEDYFDVFNYITYAYTDNIDVYFFYIVETKAVTFDNVNIDKGNLQLSKIGENYVADYDSSYTFSYEVKAQYSQNTPVITIKMGLKTYDLIALKDIVSGTVKKSDTLSYVVSLTGDGYKYVLSNNTLGAVDGNTYYVSVANGVYTISYGSDTSKVEIATIKFENNKQIITLNKVNDDLSIDVNDEMFEFNSYTITFKHGDGSIKEFTVKYGNKLIDIPTEEKSFIQKLVYVVTYSDGTTEQLSSKGLAKKEISDDMTIEIKVEINLVILIPLVVGAVVVVVAIVVGITKVARNRNDRHSSGRSNMEAFDKLRQDRNPNNYDASKKSDRPYNPYIDNSKDRRQ